MAYDPADLRLPAWLIRALDALVLLQIPITPSWRFGMSRPGVLLAGVLIGLWSAAFYSGNNLLYLCGAMLTALAMVSVWQAAQLLKSMPLFSACFPEHTQSGESFVLRSLCPPHFQPEQHRKHKKKMVPEALPYIGLVDIQWYAPDICVALQARMEDSILLTGRLMAQGRGVYRLGKQRMTTTAPLGLWKISCLRDDPVDWVVAPEAIAWPMALVGESGKSQAVEGDELRDLRGYVPGDAISRIHWRKAAADITQWSVKRFEQHRADMQDLKLRVDLRLPDAMSAHAFETLLGRAWYWVSWHLKNGENHILITLGQQLFDISLPGQKQAFIKTLAKALPQSEPPASGDGLLLSLMGET